jgi:hypothetical protein
MLKEGRKIWDDRDRERCLGYSGTHTQCRRRTIRIIKSRRMRWAGHVARMGEKRNMYRLLVGKRPLGRP